MRGLLILGLVLILLTAPAAAADVDAALQETLGVDQLEDGLTETERELLGDAQPIESGSLLHHVQTMLSKAFLKAGDALRQSAVTAAMLLAICLACGLCGTLDRSGPVQTVTLAGILAVSGLSLKSADGLIRLGTETVHSLSAFSQLLLPILSSAAVASGAATGGPALYGVTVLFSDLLLHTVTGVMIPLLYVFLALGAADCATGNAMLKRFRELLSWTIRTGLKAVLYLFTGFLAITQVISGTADAMTTKAAKLTLSGVVPVVGSIISDASETLLISAGLLKNSVGIYGMLAILAVCILPFVRIGVHYLVLKLTAAVSGTVAQENLVTMIDILAEAMGLLLAMTGACALLFLISAVCSLKAVGW